jgi:ABC-type branched-chain amino acid transport systems, ATPase component
MNPAETLELSDQIRSLRTMGLTILLIEHKLNVVNDIADKIIVSTMARRSRKDRRAGA